MNLGELQQKTRQRLQTEKQQMEQAVSENLQDFEKSLKESMQGVVHTIKHDMQIISNRTKIYTKFSLKIFLFNAIFSFCLIIGIVLGSLALSEYLHGEILLKMQEVETLRSQIEEKSLLLAKIEMDILQQEKHYQAIQTLGVEVHQEKNKDGLQEKILILPHGMKAETGWQLRGKEVIKLIQK